MNLELEDLTSAPERFFDILPNDWRVDIEPFWPEYSGDSKIYGLLENESVIAGGIVFTKVSPDTMGYREVSQKWFDLGYHYMAFIYVLENRRGEGLGSQWIRKVKSLNENQKYWLAIENHDLASFYRRLGFNVVQKVQNAEVSELILTDS